LQEQCALADGEFRFGADAEKLRCFLFKAVVMIGGQSFERRPLLSAVTNELAFVFTNRAAWRRSEVALNCVPHCAQIKFSIAR